MRVGFIKFTDVLVRAILLLTVSLVTSLGSAMAAPRIVVMGDSLSAGYGINVDTGWVKLLDERLASQGYEYQVVNASISGETTGGGKVRLPALLKTHQPAIVILELGANDGLRGLPVKPLHDNLAAMIDMAQAAHAQVLLIGMQIPPNYGEQYTVAFHDTYAELAKRYRLKWVPFLLERVALEPGLMQGDNLHPNERAQPRLLDNIWPALQPLLKTPTKKAAK